MPAEATGIIFLPDMERLIAEATSDAYGDFRFGGLEEASGAYKVCIADRRFAPKTLEVALGKSAVLGTIMLEQGPAV